MTGTASPYQPEPEGANRDFYDRQALIAAMQQTRMQGSN
jgi:hypothetical protein